eukprot:4922740-Karenia_brevis.AAC.1
MSLSAEDKFRKRALMALKESRPFSARGEVNQANLEEVCRECAQCVPEPQADSRASRTAC